MYFQSGVMYFRIECREMGTHPPFARRSIHCSERVSRNFTAHGVARTSSISAALSGRVADSPAATRLINLARSASDCTHLPTPRPSLPEALALSGRAAVPPGRCELLEVQEAGDHVYAETSQDLRSRSWTSGRKTGTHGQGTRSSVFCQQESGAAG